MTTYQYFTSSNAAPFFSDTGQSFIESSCPMAALRMTVDRYDHPMGLYSAVIKSATPGNETLAQYLSANAATSKAAGCGVHKWEGNTLFVDGKEMSVMPEEYNDLSKESK